MNGHTHLGHGKQRQKETGEDVCAAHEVVRVSEVRKEGAKL